MRITGGELKGRQIKTPRGGVRPTQERVREALFSSIGPALEGKRILDLYAGTGALGLEAWSRGAGEVTWVENDARTWQVLKSNVSDLCGASVARGCVRADAFRFLARCAEPHDFILADPPYEGHTDAVQTTKLLEQIYERNCLQPDGGVIVEQRASQAVMEHPAWQILKDKKYGDTRILFYVLNPEP